MCAVSVFFFVCLLFRCVIILQCSRHSLNDCYFHFCFFLFVLLLSSLLYAFLFSASLSHCVVSRSTSVIIITSALYFLCHAVQPTPLDTFFYSVYLMFALFLRLSHSESNRIKNYSSVGFFFPLRFSLPFV